MIAALRAEFRKLLTVRSTYIASLLGLLFIAFMTFYIEGIRGSEERLGTSNYLESMLVNAPPVVAQIGLFVTAMLIIHEYRFNTIGYTLSANSSRTKVLLSKML